MKRILSLLAVMAVMTAMVAASAMPAFAEINAPNPNANCVGQVGALFNQAGKLHDLPGYGGQFLSYGAHQLGGLGEEASGPQVC